LAFFGGKIGVENVYRPSQSLKGLGDDFKKESSIEIGMNESGKNTGKSITRIELGSSTGEFDRLFNAG